MSSTWAIIFMVSLSVLGIASATFEKRLTQFELRLYRDGPPAVRAVISVTVAFREPSEAEPRIRLNVRASAFGMFVAALATGYHVFFDH
jgi:hypothetical protein